MLSVEQQHCFLYLFLLLGKMTLKMEVLQHVLVMVVVHNFSLGTCLFFHLLRWFWNISINIARSFVFSGRFPFFFPSKFTTKLSFASRFLIRCSSTLTTDPLFETPTIMSWMSRLNRLLISCRLPS